MKEILARLGFVLNWVGLGIAAICAAGAITIIGVGLFDRGDPSNVTFGAASSAAIGVAAWLTGRACKYILAGK